MVVIGADSVKRLTLLACILASSIAMLDSTVVNVALPTIQRDLGGGLAAQQWVVNVYLLTLGSLILIGGSLGDLFGERRVFALGVAGFGAASALCALAPSIEVLIAARAVQGLASALLTPGALAVIVATFTTSERGGAIGSWTAWAGIATMLGPLAGGELLDIGSWRLIFLLNLPLVAICVTLILLVVPKAHASTAGPRTVDIPGALLCALGLGGLVFALIEQPRLGWSDPLVAGSLIGGLLLLCCFAWREVRTPDPMLPMGLFRANNFTVGNLQTLAVYAGLAVLFFYLVIFLQQIGGYTPLKSGLAMVPTTLVMFAFSRRFGALADRYGPRLFMGGGPLIAACGLLLLQRTGAAVSYLADVLPALLIFSIGLSMTVAPLTAAVLAGVRSGQAGIASAVNNAIARIAGALGTAAVGAGLASVFVTRLHGALHGSSLEHGARVAVNQASRLPLGIPNTSGLRASQASIIDAAARQASLDAFHMGMGIAAALLALGGLVGIIGIQNPKRVVRAEQCEGGQILGAALDVAGCGVQPPAREPAVVADSV